MRKLTGGLLILIGGIIASCADTPNDVNLSVQQGQCVTGSFPGYESTQTLSPAFPANANMQAQSPYCAAVTLTNNNSGKNANNIQVSGSGLQISYTLPGTTNQVTVNLLDFNASGVESTNFGTPPTVYQTAFNMALFDPNNCVTTLGANVKTYGTGGQSCTFYMQLLTESLPVGVYPFQLNVNYSNGNGFYNTTTTLNQRVNLYMGGTINPSLQLTNGQGSNNAASTANSPEINQVLSLTRDIFGNVYTGDNIGTIYKYNGTSVSSWASIATGVNSNINALTSDSSGNVYAAFSSGAVVEITPTESVISLGMPAANLSTIAIQGDSLYVTAGASSYSCTLPATSTCNWSPLNPATSTINSLLATPSGLLAGIGGSISQFAGGNWAPYGASGLPGGDVVSMAYPSLSLFAGITQTNSSDSVVWSSTSNADFTAVLSASGNIIGGGSTNQLFQVASDAGGGVFVAGIGLNSPDFESTQNAVLAYSYPQTPAALFGVSSNWAPISVLAGNGVTVLQTASQLTSY